MPLYHDTSLSPVHPHIVVRHVLWFIQSVLTYQVPVSDCQRIILKGIKPVVLTVQGFTYLVCEATMQCGVIWL